MATFTARTSSYTYPNNSVYYYGNPFNIPECTAYAWGRWAENGVKFDTVALNKMGNWNSKNWWYNLIGTYQHDSDIPKVGAIMCFSGSTGNAKNGHVAIVEDIVGDKLIISEDGAGFGTSGCSEINDAYRDANGKWTIEWMEGYGNYTFKGFVYFPGTEQETNTSTTNDELQLQEPKNANEELWAFLTIPEDRGGCGCSSLGAAIILGNCIAESGSEGKGSLNDIISSRKQEGNVSNFTQRLLNGQVTKNEFITRGDGWGIMQWTNAGRRKKLWEYWENNYKNKGHNIDSLEMQANFMWQEMKGYRWQGQTLTKTLQELPDSDFDNLSNVLKSFHDCYVGSADWQRNRTNQINRRINGAKNHYEALKNINFSLNWEGITNSSISNTTSTNENNEIPLSNLLKLDGTNYKMKYNTPDSILQCIATENNNYESAETFNSDYTPSFIIYGSDQNASQYIKDYAWPSQTDPHFEERVGQLGEYNLNHWNHGNKPTVHYIIGRAKNGTITTMQTWPLTKKSNISSDETAKKCISIYVLQDFSDTTTYNKIYWELVHVLAYLCCFYKVNPLRVNSLLKPVPYITTPYETIQNKQGEKTNPFDILLEKCGLNIDNIRTDVERVIRGEVDQDPTPNTLNISGIGEIFSFTDEQFNQYFQQWLDIKEKRPPNTYSKAQREWAEKYHFIQNDKYQKYLTRQEAVEIIYRYLQAYMANKDVEYYTQEQIINVIEQYHNCYTILNQNKALVKKIKDTIRSIRGGVYND